VRVPAARRNGSCRECRAMCSARANAMQQRAGAMRQTSDQTSGGPFANGRRRSGDAGTASLGNSGRAVGCATCAGTVNAVTDGSGATAVVAQQWPTHVQGPVGACLCEPSLDAWCDAAPPCIACDAALAWPACAPCIGHECSMPGSPRTMANQSAKSAAKGRDHAGKRCMTPKDRAIIYPTANPFRGRVVRSCEAPTRIER
jgi:hypothetical protein